MRIYFVVNLFLHLKGKPKQGRRGANACPFQTSQWNIIRSLVVEQTCNCMCYTMYVIAMAEEFQDIVGNVSTCSIPGHIFLSVYDDFGTQMVQIDGSVEGPFILAINPALPDTQTEEILVCSRPDITWIRNGTNAIQNWPCTFSWS